MVIGLKQFYATLLSFVLYGFDSFERYSIH